MAELRWALPTARVAAERLRRECPSWPRQGLHLDLLQDRGVPLLEVGLPNWGVSKPSWGVLQQLLQLPACSCGGPPAIPAARHGGSGRAVLPARAGQAAPASCRWCRHGGVVGADACGGCHSEIHLRGSCRAWNRGAHHLYQPSAVTAIVLCPDCMWDLAQAVQASPRGPPSVRAHGRLFHHMQAVALQCHPGAGHLGPPVQDEVTLRRVRRWILRAVTRRGRARQAHLIGEAVAHFGPDTEERREELEALGERALLLLCREGQASAENGWIGHTASAA